MTIGALFAGIGGLELGLSRAGLGPVSWHVEIDEDARRVLAHHWPEAASFADVRDVSIASGLAPVDVVCGGFPCQDLSSANVRGRRGLDGPKSGLWREFRRIVGEVRPRIVVVENVESGWRDWVPVVRSDLHGLGWSSVPVSLSSASLGAPHDRRRVFVVAYPHGEAQRLRAFDAKVARASEDLRRDRAAWRAECREAVSRNDALPARLARLPGNAVVPIVAEALGRAVLECFAP